MAFPMLKISVKDEYKDEIVGFNNSGAPLGQRSQEDLEYLARLAHENNPAMKRYFQDLPTLEELKGNQADKFLQQHSSLSDDEA